MRGGALEVLDREKCGSDSDVQVIRQKLNDRIFIARINRFRSSAKVMIENTGKIIKGGALK